jgi:CubicO group peptidase (beta-lactamase class C family)
MDHRVSMSPLSGLVRGHADDRLGEIVDRLEKSLGADEDYSFQVAAYHDGEIVLDASGGPHLFADSLIVPFSVTKNCIGLSVALLIERGAIDPDERVAHYWPAFAAKGKQDVTVRMLLSHQAGLPQATPALTWDEVLDDHAAAIRLAQTRPFWHPGSAFGYHALTIGNLASELVFQVTGRTLRDFYEQELRAPLGVDFYLGLPPELDHRRVPVLPMIPPVTPPATSFGSLLTPVAMTMSGPEVDFANGEESWRFGHPSGSGTGSARAIAQLFAATVTGLEGSPSLLSADTIDIVGQQQVRGYDEVLGQPDRSHSIVFQKPTPAMPFGGHRAFGHDGAAGGLACVDPETGVAFAYTVARGPWPGGADPRAVAIAAELGRTLSS